MRSEVADATGNVKYIRKSLCTSSNSVLVTGVVESCAHGPYICYLTYFGKRSSH